MPFHDLSEFLKLSAVLTYQLSAKHINWRTIETIILEKPQLLPEERDVLLNVLKYLNKIYGRRKRRLGSLAVLHPLRVAVLLARASDHPSLLELLTTLLHDVYEDIQPNQMNENSEIKPDHQFYEYLTDLSWLEKRRLLKRLAWLTKRPHETYYQYVGRFLDQAVRTPEAVRVKLADRLDNTLDLRIDLEDPLQGVDFFEVIFQVLFSRVYQGYQAKMPHSSVTALNGAERLYQLFKNIVLMSLIRQKEKLARDEVVKVIFENLARASMKEAQRIALHIFAYHEKDVASYRKLLIETMEYVQKGGIDSVTAPTNGYRLDGLMVSRFDDPVKEKLKRKLAVLYRDKPLMIQAAIAFIVIFLSFLNDPHYYVRGISPEGVRPEVNT